VARDRKRRMAPDCRGDNLGAANEFLGSPLNSGCARTGSLGGARCIEIKMLIHALPQPQTRADIQRVESQIRANVLKRENPILLAAKEPALGGRNSPRSGLPSAPAKR